MAKEIGAYSPETAAMVLRVIDQLVSSGYVTKKGQRKDDRWTETAGVIAQVPSGGIAGRNGLAVNKAICIAYRIEDGLLVKLLDNNGNEQQIEVYHLGTAEIAADAWIQAKWTHGVWVADMEDCS